MNSQFSRFESVLIPDEDPWCFSKDPLDLHSSWLKSQIKRTNMKIETAFRKPRNKGDDLERLDTRQLERGVLTVLAGHLDKTVRDFILTCYSYSVPIPYVTLRQDSRFTGKREPLKEAYGLPVTAYNLTPEWLRHFLSIMYTKEIWEKTVEEVYEKRREDSNCKDGFFCKYFPFNNQDHFIHSILTAAIGSYLLMLPMSRVMTEKVVKGVHRKHSDLAQGGERLLRRGARLVNLISFVLKSRCPSLRADAAVVARIKALWPAMALWHDSGYDDVTWLLLATREFTHSRITQLPETKKHLRQILPGMLADLEKLAAGHVDFKKYIAGLVRELNLKHIDNCYHQLWAADGCSRLSAAGKCSCCDKNQREWGRLHALLSSWEFYYRFANGEQKNDLLFKEAVWAIALHHESRIRYKYPTEKKRDIFEVEEFIRNPLAVLLQFADTLAAFNRVKIPPLKKDEKQLIDLGRHKGSLHITLELQNNTIRVHRDDEVRYRFSKHRAGSKKCVKDSFDDSIKPTAQTFWGSIYDLSKEKHAKK